MYNAISQNKITHLIEPRSKRTLCRKSVRKGNWQFSTKSIHPKCEHCERENSKNE